jgi:hypothetical protein
MLVEAALLLRSFGHLIFCDSMFLRFRFRNTVSNVEEFCLRLS